MAQSIREVMSTDLAVLPPTASHHDAAREMRDRDIGDVLVAADGRLQGMVTDRDIVVRALAEGRDSVSIGDICSGDLATLSPTDSVEDAIRLMRDRAVRRIPVVEDGRPVGMVSIGDLAIERDPESALAGISAAAPNE